VCLESNAVFPFQTAEHSGAWIITWYFLERVIAVHITLQTQLHRVLELIPASAAGVILSIRPMELLQVGGKDWHWSWRLLASRTTECQLFVLIVSKDHLMNTQDVDMTDFPAWKPTEMDT
jgi:hypothetical protein